MQAGRLRDTITISRATTTQNCIGEDVPAFASLGDFPAEIRPLQGRELEIAQQTFAEASFKIKMRFQPEFTFKRTDRILWGSRLLDILDVEDPDQGRRELILLCKEIDTA